MHLLHHHVVIILQLFEVDLFWLLLHSRGEVFHDVEQFWIVLFSFYKVSQIKSLFIACNLTEIFFYLYLHFFCYFEFSLHQFTLAKHELHEKLHENLFSNLSGITVSQIKHSKRLSQLL
jgi:hypothetical protein